MVDVVTKIKAEAIAIAIDAATGEKPTITYYDTYAELSWAPDQVKRLSAFLEAQLSKAPGDIRINIMPVLTPVLIKKYLPIAAGLAAGGFVLGKMKF